MTEILLTRHAKSYANARDVAFGNEESPLNDKGAEQAKDLTNSFREHHGINPVIYGRAVVASEFVRPYQTAQLAGFTQIERSGLINEVVIDPELLAKGLILTKHRDERWIPPQLQDRATEFIDKVRLGELAYQIYFTHGFFIAAVLDNLSVEYEARGEPSPYAFDAIRGFIPKLATITPVSI